MGPMTPADPKAIKPCKCKPCAGEAEGEAVNDPLQRIEELALGTLVMHVTANGYGCKHCAKPWPCPTARQMLKIEALIEVMRQEKASR